MALPFARASVLLALLTFASGAWSQVEPIGPLVLVPNQPIHSVFANQIPPQPDYKELQFTGMAATVPGAVGQFSIDFDYLDSAGNIVLVPAPNSPIMVPGGGPMAFDSGILRLPFCPLEVSLQLTNTGPTPGAPITLVGQFRHECFPVPEPTSVVLLGTAAMWFFGRRRPHTPPGTC